MAFPKVVPPDDMYRHLGENNEEGTEERGDESPRTSS